jgi:hypothetical protein
VALWLNAPLVPVIVMGPDEAEADVEMFSVELPEPLTEVGLKLAVTPAGKLPVLSATLPAKPFRAPTLTV